MKNKTMKSKLLKRIEDGLLDYYLSKDYTLKKERDPDKPTDKYQKKAKEILEKAKNAAR